MTLSTDLNFLKPVDPEAVFGIARRIIGIPQDHPFDVKHWCADDPNTWLASQMGGFRSALDVTIAPNGEGEFNHYHRIDDGKSYSCVLLHKKDSDCSCRKWYVSVRLDTTYGYEKCCTCIHYEIVRKLIEAFPNTPYEWDDEFTGTWYSNVPPPEKCEYHGGVMPESLVCST